MRQLIVACLYLALLRPTVATDATQLFGFTPRQLNHGRPELDTSMQHIVQPGHDSLLEQGHVLEELRHTLDVLQDTWYELSLGRWPCSIDWTGAVLNTHLVTTLTSFSEAWHSASDDGPVDRSDNLIDLYFAQASAYYYGEHAVSLRQQAYDDMLWVVLSWLESIKMISSHSERLYGNSSAWYGSQYTSIFARRAWSFYNITTQGWTVDLCGGGMLWSPEPEPYKNAITNQLYISASIGMYLYFPELDNSSSTAKLPSSRHHYLTNAIEAYDWLTSSNMTNRQGLYVDGFHVGGWNMNGTGGVSCNKRNEMVYSYNQGVLLSGLRGLWQATSDQTYLLDGHRLVRSTIAATGWLLDENRPINNTSWQGLGRTGVMEDYCDSTGKCDQNQHTFKSIYFHHLAAFCKGRLDRQNDNVVLRWHLRQCKRYLTWTAYNARAALKTQDTHGRIGTWWGVSQRGAWRAFAVPELPSGAVDYRHGHGTSRPSKHREHVSGVDMQPDGQGDPNARGRGRTVESHVGGVAVLQCLWQLLGIE